MNWTRFTIHTTTEAEDLVCAMLQDLGISGIEIVDSLPVEDGDRQGGVFEELQPDLPQDDGTSRICFYVEEGTDTGELLESVCLGLDDLRVFTDIGEGTITSDETREEDWINNWKQYFSSFTVGNLYIKPTWEETEEIHRDKLMIEIDPGVSFGTGKHETTQLCLLQMQKYLKKGDLLLDVRLAALSAVDGDADVAGVLGQLRHLPVGLQRQLPGGQQDDGAGQVLPGLYPPQYD